jgi:hypothetical protein
VKRGRGGTTPDRLEGGLQRPTDHFDIENTGLLAPLCAQSASRTPGSQLFQARRNDRVRAGLLPLTNLLFYRQEIVGSCSPFPIFGSL